MSVGPVLFMHAGSLYWEWPLLHGPLNVTVGKGGHFPASPQPVWAGCVALRQACGPPKNPCELLSCRTPGALCHPIFFRVLPPLQRPAPHPFLNATPETHFPSL